MKLNKLPLVALIVGVGVLVYFYAANTFKPGESKKKKVVSKSGEENINSSDDGMTRDDQVLQRTLLNKIENA